MCYFELSNSIYNLVTDYKSHLQYTKMASKFNTQVFESANMIVLLSIIIFFMVVQTLFFKYVASKQFNIVLEDKANIVGEYLKHDPAANEKFRQFKNSEKVKSIEKAAKEQEAIREKDNMASTLKWIGLPLLIAVLFLIFFIGKLYFKSEEWDTVDTMLLSFVVFSYVVEVLFYVGVVKQYQFYGDQAIYDNLFHNVSNNVNKNPITSRGKQLDDNLETTINGFEEGTNDAEDLKSYYVSTQKKLRGQNKDSIASYMQAANISNISNSVNLNAIGQLGKYT